MTYLLSPPDPPSTLCPIRTSSTWKMPSAASKVHPSWGSGFRIQGFRGLEFYACRPLINKPLPFKGLNIRTPFNTLMKGRSQTLNLNPKPGYGLGKSPAPYGDSARRLSEEQNAQQRELKSNGLGGFRVYRRV